MAGPTSISSHPKKTRTVLCSFRCEIQALHNPGGPVLASETMACRDNQPTGGRTVASASPPGSPITGGGRDCAPPAGPMASAGLLAERSRLVAKGLPAAVIATIQSSRASSTRTLYSYKWRAFEHWCLDKDLVPFQCSVVDIFFVSAGDF